MRQTQIQFSRKQVESAIQFVAAAALILIVVQGLMSCWYKVEGQNGEQAVIQRFGRYERTVAEAGLHFKIPFGIDTVTIERVKEVRRAEVGFRSKQSSRHDFSGRRPVARDEPQHSISITRDHNLVDAEFVVQYEISNLKLYLFKSADPDLTVGQAAKAVMRDVIANRDIDDILTTGRDAMQREALEALQNILDGYNIGIRIMAVQFQDVHAPQRVIPAFNDVQKAKEERETFINEGKLYTNRVIPKAEGEAARVITQAEGYKIRRINEARGDASRFQAIYRRYKVDPELTRRQLYLQV